MKTGFVFQQEEKFMKFKEKNTTKTHQIINEFLQFWEIQDRVFHTNHKQILQILYFKDQVNLTIAAYEGFVCDKTLYTYRKTYMAVFESICELHKPSL